MEVCIDQDLGTVEAKIRSQASFNCWDHIVVRGATFERASGARSWRHPKGSPANQATVADLVVEDNVGAIEALKSLERRRLRNGVTVVEVAVKSWFLAWPRVKALVSAGWLYVEHCEDAVLLHGSVALHRCLVDCGRVDWQDFYPGCVAEELRNARLSLIPREPGAQGAWLRGRLREASARMGQEEVNRAMAGELRRMLGGMKHGAEAEHLKYLLRCADRRGSDVQLWSGELLRNTRQTAPYPAFHWQWEARASYQWKESAHINVLEVRAFVNFLRKSLESGSLARSRFVHVVDSMVAAAVIAKGRSSSKALNFGLRQLAGLCLAGDSYPFIVWTISSWNFADAASRAFEKGGGKTGFNGC